MQQRKKANTVLSLQECKYLWIRQAAARMAPLLPDAQAENYASVDSITGALCMHDVLTESAHWLEMPSRHPTVRLGDIVTARLAQAYSAQLSLRTNYA